MDFETRISKHKLDQHFDLIIIGGGINGAGIARDAAERGMKVLLLEQNDFGSGCSAHSTRLIHGGLRYLEHLEFGLVGESLCEREQLLQSYPNLVQPINLMIPCYKHSKHGYLKLNLGMILYDLLSFNKSLNNYKAISKSQAKNLQLGINKVEIEGAVSYFDAQVPFAERLVLENVLTAQDNGAICLNHCKVTEISCKPLNDKATEFKAEAVKFKDLLNFNRTYTATADNILNLTGAAVDLTNTKLKQANSYPTHKLKNQIGATKGSHIVVREFAGAPKDFGIYTEAASDKRPFFILPLQVGCNERLYLIGTTDIFLNDAEKTQDPSHVKITNPEINYLLEETNHAFPRADLTRTDVIKTYCGVRPLPVSNDLEAGTVSRKHFIISHNHNGDNIQNYYSVVGGKLTTFRNLAKEVVDRFSNYDSITATKPTIGCNFRTKTFTQYLETNVENFSKEYGLNSETVLHLILLYGTQAENILELSRLKPELKEKVHPDYMDIKAQIVYALRYELACTPEDILNRRLSIGLCLGEVPDSVLATIKEYIAEEFKLQNKNSKFIESIFNYQL